MLKAQQPVGSSDTLINKTAELACGECKFKMKGKGCNLAIRYNSKTYYVDGKSIDDFGDAHDEHTGLCNVVRKAIISGTIINGRFKASAVKLVMD